MNPQDQIVTMQGIEKSCPLLKSSWSLFKNSWKTLVTIVVIPSLLNLVSGLLYQTKMPVLVIFGVIISIAAGILSVVMTIALINAIHSLSGNPSAVISIKGIYKSGFGYFWSVVLISIIVGLSSLGSFMLLVVPGIIISIYVTFSAYALVIDGKKGFSAVTESYSLVKGRWMTVFGRLIILGLCVLGIQLIVALINFALAYALGINVYEIAAAKGQIPYSVSLIGFALSLISNSFIGPISAIYTYRLYNSLKATRGSEVSVVNFKRWIIAFMIIGPILFVALVIVPAVFILLNQLK